jgi:hypothetical protein
MLSALLVMMTIATATELAPQQDAEVRRARAEMETLARRGAWNGVERMYRMAVATGGELRAADHVLGASASSAIGDLGATRDRLLSAHALGEEKAVIDWLWEIDEGYGPVDLRSDDALEALSIVALPNQLRAVELATFRLDETQSFYGYLPVGEYAMGRVEFVVEPRGERVEVDALPEKRRRSRR